MISFRRTRGLRGGKVAGMQPGGVALHILTRTRVDVGSWICKRRVSAYVVERNLLLVAPGRRPHVENVPFDSLQDSLYNHVTGEVVLGPAEGVKVTRLRMSPLEARRLLESIGPGFRDMGDAAEARGAPRN